MVLVKLSNLYRSAARQNVNLAARISFKRMSSWINVLSTIQRNMMGTIVLVVRRQFVLEINNAIGADIYV